MSCKISRLLFPIPLLAILLNSYPLKAEEWSIALRDVSGNPLELRSNSGRPTLLSFYFSNCPTACPMQTSKLVNLHYTLSEKLKKAVSFVSISIDPDRDSAANIKAFASRMTADTDSWKWTAPERKEDLDQLLKRLNLPATVDPTTKTIDHQMTIVLLDGDGTVRQRYQGTMFSSESLKNDLDALVRLQEKPKGKAQ